MRAERDPEWSAFKSTVWRFKCFGSFGREMHRAYHSNSFMSDKSRAMRSPAPLRSAHTSEALVGSLRLPCVRRPSRFGPRGARQNDNSRKIHGPLARSLPARVFSSWHRPKQRPYTRNSVLLFTFRAALRVCA